ncbi:MAG: archaetidylserine decarboxylase [Limisphaerales bacterium]
MTDADTIEFFNRYTGKVEREQVYGGNWLRWVYTSPLGRLSLKLLVKRACFSNWYGKRMDHPSSREKILPFIKEFSVDAGEFADPCDSYKTFNEFFYRKLKPGARPVDPNPNSVVFPADGRHLGFQDLSKVESIFVKGQQFDLPALLGDAALAKRYANGTLVLSRLCPVDYHRFHFPAAGVPGEPRFINGPLFSVNPLALRKRVAYLWENRRMITPLATERLGQVLLIEIGATNVGSIVQTFKPGQAVAKGDEKGYFRFGGSSTITLFEPGKVTLAADLVENSQHTRELYARVGDRMAATRTTYNL